MQIQVLRLAASPAKIRAAERSLLTGFLTCVYEEVRDETCLSRSPCGGQDVGLLCRGTARGYT